MASAALVVLNIPLQFFQPNSIVGAAQWHCRSKATFAQPLDQLDQLTTIR